MGDYNHSYVHANKLDTSANPHSQTNWNEGSVLYMLRSSPQQWA